MELSIKYAAGVGKPVKGQAGKTVTEKPRKKRRREDLAREADRERGMAQGKGNSAGKGEQTGERSRVLTGRIAPAISQAARQMGVDPVDNPSQ